MFILNVCMSMYTEYLNAFVGQNDINDLDEEVIYTVKNEKIHI